MDPRETIEKQIAGLEKDLVAYKNALYAVAFNFNTEGNFIAEVKASRDNVIACQCRLDELSRMHTTLFAPVPEPRPDNVVSMKPVEE